MAAPTYDGAAAGATDAGGAWSYNGLAASVGSFLVLHVVQDGTSGAPSITSVTNRAALDGTADSMTSVGSFQIGGTSLAIHYVWVGRNTSTTAAVYTGANSGTDDIYVREYSFDNVADGTTLASVLENVTAGSTTVSNGTSATVSDASVTTLGVDRLAINLVGINDDNPFAGFTGETGGTWTTADSYASSTGTDGALYLCTAAMASAGTIDGGTSSITDSDAWGVIGFALIGTTPAPVRVPRFTPYPQLLAH